MKTLIISYASKGREDYHKGLKRLIDSCKGYELRMYSPDMVEREYNGVEILTPNVTPHSEVPYKFKLDLIQQAVKDGYESIVWLDSSLQVVRNLDELFNNTAGFCFHNLGHPLKNYISDLAVDNLIMSDIELKTTPQIWGGAFGLDFSNPDAHKILRVLIRQSEIGSFNDGSSTREGFIAHRHDQAVMSVIFNRFKVKMYDYGYITTASHCFEPYEFGNHSYIHHLSI